MHSKSDNMNIMVNDAADERKHSEKISRIKPLTDKYKWKATSYPSGKDD